MAFILLITIPSGAPLRHPETDELIGSTPFMDNLIALILISFLIPGICFERQLEKSNRVWM